MVLVYLRSDVTGLHLAAGGSGGALHTTEHVGDDAVWEMSGPDDHSYTLTSAATPTVLRALPVAPVRAPYGERGVSVHVEAPGGRVVTDGLEGAGSGGDHDVTAAATAASPAVFTALTAPPRLPSTYVAEMDERGFATIEGVLQPDDLRELNAARAAMEGDMARRHQLPSDGRFSLDSAELLSTTPTMAKASFHPVALWVIQRYLGVRDLQESHIPVFTVLKPAGETLRHRRPAGGWVRERPSEGPGECLGSVLRPYDLMQCRCGGVGFL
jgi:hypothetical protein